MLKKEILVHDKITVKTALKKLDLVGEKVLFVIDRQGKLIGAISDSDIRRHLLKGRSIEDTIEDVYNRNPVFISKDLYSPAAAKKIFIEEERRIEVMPVVDGKGHVVDHVAWRQLFTENEMLEYSTGSIDIPVVIMAGGAGTRLEPFTKILPKPLIPVGDKPMIEIIMDFFSKMGAAKYYIILNHKGEMVESYLSGSAKTGQIRFMRETSYLGTIGGLKLIEDQIEETFIVSNCDVIVKADFRDAVRHHKETGALLTVLSSVRHYEIPYGVISFKEKGEIVDIIEKPEYTFIINSGVYIMSREVLDFIREGVKMDINDLMRILMKNKKKLITYPVNEKDYIDIGQWEEYKKTIARLEHLEI